MIKDKVLFYFTSSFPFGSGEQFVASEIDALSKFYEEIFILPLAPKEQEHSKNLPENVTVKLISDANRVYKKTDLFSRMGTFCKILGSEFFRKRGYLTLFSLKYVSIEILKAVELTRKIKSLSDSVSNDAKVDYYSSWMNEWSLALAVLYGKKEISNFTFKMRGHDLFDERRKNEFMPFRNFIFRNSSCRLSMSKEGVNYLNGKGFSHVEVNYPGIEIKGAGHYEQNTVFTLVSCSNMVALKRVDLIAESLNYIDFELRWIHFGGGEEMQRVATIVAKLPPNIKVELRGQSANTEILDFYQKNQIDAFIHLSLTEGFGYAIVEAFSYGIPGILFPGGAVEELIQEDYCVRVPLNADARIVAASINDAKLRLKRDQKLGNVIIEDCARKFDHETQGLELYNFIAGIKKN